MTIFCTRNSSLLSSQWGKLPKLIYAKATHHQNYYSEVVHDLSDIDFCEYRPNHAWKVPQNHDFSNITHWAKKCHNYSNSSTALISTNPAGMLKITPILMVRTYEAGTGKGGICFCGVRDERGKVQIEHGSHSHSLGSICRKWWKLWDLEEHACSWIDQRQSGGRL